MSGPAGIESHAPPSARSGPSWHVRAATRNDVPAAAASARELLIELGGTPPSMPALEMAARTLIDDHKAGALFVADAQGSIIGVLGASLQIAMHVPGRYALIQDLWVHPSWRSRAIGGALIAALCQLAREQRLVRIEVGLPRERFAQILATEAFYVRNGFEPLGARMRRVLP
jgi:GNAT superfamily N-acetyltransferase